MVKDVTLIIALFLAALAFILPKKYFLLPYIIAACFVPTDQRILIGSLNFTALRILIAVGVLRMFMRGEVVRIKWNAFDVLFLVWMIYRSIVYMVLHSEMQAVINRSGMFYDGIGCYWLFRQNIRSWDDVETVFKIFAFSVLFMAPLVALEWKTGHNPFASLGTVTTDIREGRYRCQASFPHSILLGLFWATILPIFIGLAAATRKKIFYGAVAASVFIIISTASSTPVATMLEILLLLALFRYWRYGRQMVYGLCGLAVILHFVRDKPVWHLLSRVNIVGGSTGYHRYRLIDNAINHFNEWALMGTKSTTNWGWMMQDVTNNYIAEGVDGGLITMLLFIVLLVWAVKIAGSFSLCRLSHKEQWLVWCICAAVLGHCVSFIGVTYFGQIRMLFYLTLALIGWLYSMLLNVQAAPIAARSRMATTLVQGQTI